MSNAREHGHSQPVLAAKSLTKHYETSRGTVAAFERIDLTVSKGELVCLLGASGCGKSSLLLTLAGLYRATSGEVRLYGRRLDGPDPTVSLIFQDPCLLPWLNARHNAAFGLRFNHSRHVTRRETIERTDDALQRVGLHGCELRYPAQLSGGMAQRVSLARALVRRSELLLLDEPFGALDAITRLEMQQLLRSLIHEQACTAVLITHDIDEALLLANRVLLMGGSPGRICHEWVVDIPHPREEHPRPLGELRLDVFRELAHTLAGQRADVVTRTNGGSTEDT
ncbi:ABC transporter ATP-binding protein [Nitrospira sp. KM1]|uniref:ABC transporter ATP-binding protein n=1 Tax=Nitrospira sp. KM1 TaxID=1936990 RepID=UPI0013A73C92|nr:ABC transporter ATP-binding protein [Nitrospira sp. KM1]BCA52993.1 ABC transporter ATP-binding protein [Nitrospira sp. KM1]